MSPMSYIPIAQVSKLTMKAGIPTKNNCSQLLLLLVDMFFCVILTKF